MCGISGFVGQSASLPEQKNLLQQMTDCLAHRGPDGSDIWCEETVGLGHRRLAIIDLNTGHQPMWDSHREQVIVFNGEIYNYPELRKELETRGHVFQTVSDTEVIPAAIREWGINRGLLKLRGMFSFALYNIKTKKLLLARDRTGIKPLFWARHNGAFYFASEAKALLLTNLAERRLDAVSIHDYLALGYAIAPRTCWKDIQFLPPGSWIEISPDGEMRQGIYWQWSPKPDYQTSEEQWLERLEATLSDALRCHLLSDVPLGAFLSGGIDSSLAVAMLARYHAKDLLTFNVMFDEAEYNEAPFARLVAEQYHTNHHEIPISSATADAEALIQCIEQFDEPFSDPASLPHYLLSRATAREVKVVLSGDGGDEVLGGYPLYRRLILLQGLTHFQWADPLLAPLLKVGAHMRVPLVYKLINAWEHAQGHVAGRLTKLLTLYPEGHRNSNYTDSFHDLALADGPTHTRISQYLQDDIPNPLDQMLALEMRMRLQAGYLRKVDITSSAHGLEVRVPFLDNQMLEFAESLPSAFKVNGGRLKYLAYKLARRYLPVEITDRPKHGFNFPFDQWSSSPAIKGFLYDLLFSPQARWRGLLKPHFIDEPWKVFTGQRNSPIMSRRGAYARIFSTTALEVWLQKWRPLI